MGSNLEPKPEGKKPSYSREIRHITR